MNCDLILNVHLVELIDATDTMISKHQGASFKTILSSLRVFADIRCQTSCARSLAAAVNCAGEELADVLEKLGLGGSWVTNNADVDVASELDFVNSIFLYSAEQLQEDAFFDVQMTIDTRGY